MICNICEKEADKTQNLCQDCHALINVLYYKFTPIQIMNLFSHVLGTKIIQEMTNTMIEQMKSSHNYEYKGDLH